MSDVRSRLFHMIGSGRVKLVADDGTTQRVQVDQGTGPDGSPRLLDDVDRIVEFGLASNPPVDSEVVLVRLGGNRTLSIVVATNHQPSRPRDLEPGDTQIYDVRGAYIKLTANGMEIDGAGLDMTVQNCPTVTVKAAAKVRVESPLVEVTGDIVSRADGTRVSLNALRDAYDAHAHGGVQGGSSSTLGTDHPV